ncbi:MAG: fuconate dehydratase [Chloroflexi bacterium]|nr:fuconate dehydratase [Chloroflexota bacterium]
MHALTITRVEALDIRFPTSLSLDGSDAMNPDPDYSVAYVMLHTDDPTRTGHGFTFTIGEGTEICVAAIRALAPHIEGASVDDLVADLGAASRRLTGISQLRWLGPEKGVVHLATSAVLNALWDLAAKLRGVPVWRLVADMTPEQLVDLVDFRYLTDALTPEQALTTLRDRAAGRAARIAELERDGYPAYTTSAGWLGYDDAKVRRLCEEAIADGFDHVKLKVGRDLEDDLRRTRIAREVIGPDRHLMVDANQVWSVPDAIDWVRALAEVRPMWIEEPTSPDDILGHAAIARAVAPVGVATGEHVQNRVVFKQLFQADAIRYAQIDACRLASVNEVLAVQLLADRFGVPVVPHAGGVGLCELVIHLAAIDMVCVSGTLEGRMVEWVDHLHEHFAEPARVVGARYRMPERPGYAELLPASMERYRYPDGGYWREALGA